MIWRKENAMRFKYRSNMSLPSRCQHYMAAPRPSPVWTLMQVFKLITNFLVRWRKIFHSHCIMTLKDSSGNSGQNFKWRNSKTGLYLYPWIQDSLDQKRPTFLKFLEHHLVSTFNLTKSLFLHGAFLYQIQYPALFHAIIPHY